MFVLGKICDKCKKDYSYRTSELYYFEICHSYYDSEMVVVKEKDLGLVLKAKYYFDKTKDTAVFFGNRKECVLYCKQQNANQLVDK